MSDRAAPWFKFYPADFMNGVRGLNATEVGLYQMLLCRLYEEGGPVEFNVLRLATYCGMREATFLKTAEKLISLGKITLSDGMISNRRFEVENSNRARDLKNNSKAGKASAKKRQQNQGQTSTPVERAFNHTDTDTDTDLSKEAAECASAKNPPPEIVTSIVAKLHHALGFDRGRTVPKYWIAPDTALIVARWKTDLGLTEDEILHVAQANTVQHGAPANGPKTLNRAMADYAAAKAASPMTPTAMPAKGLRNVRTSESRAFDQTIHAIADGLRAGTVQLDTASRDPFARRS